MKSTTKAIADDYYINRFTNAEIFEKHGLERRKPNIVQERVFEHLPQYLHSGLQCEHCGGAMESSYLGKNAELAEEELLASDTKELQNIELVRVEGGTNKRSWWNRAGSAYLVEAGYRVSVPTCVRCEHELKSQCHCDSCASLKGQNSVRAATIVYTELASLEKIITEELSCGHMLSLLKQLSELINDTSSADSLAVFERLNFESKGVLMLLNVAEVSVESVLPAIRMVSRTEYSTDWESIVFTVNNEDELAHTLSDLKLSALNLSSSQNGALDVLEMWESLAKEEALSVLEHYCGAHDVHCNPGEQTIAAVKRSLNRYGLAQTARYICNAVRRAASYAAENGHNRYRAFSFIYGNLNFWIDDPRARTYNAPPFNRTEYLLSEPKSVSAFSRFFLERNAISYFSDPISMRSLVYQASIESSELSGENNLNND